MLNKKQLCHRQVKDLPFMCRQAWVRTSPNYEALEQQLSPRSNAHVHPNSLQARQEQPDSPDSALLAEILETLMGQPEPCFHNECQANAGLKQTVEASACYLHGMAQKRMSSHFISNARVRMLQVMGFSFISLSKHSPRQRMSHIISPAFIVST